MNEHDAISEEPVLKKRGRRPRAQSIYQQTQSSDISSEVSEVKEVPLFMQKFIQEFSEFIQLFRVFYAPTIGSNNIPLAAIDAIKFKSFCEKFEMIRDESFDKV